ncbi:MAG: di-heme-cytochrome C peroxidase [Bradyrhizobium sp.]
MQDGSVSRHAPLKQLPVSSDNPCPFLRALVAEGFVDGHIVPLAKLSRTIGVASGERGLKKANARVAGWLIAFFANGFRHLLRSLWSGAELDALRNGPLDKHGAGSRILDATAHVHEAEIARLAEFGKDRPDPCGGVERGLTSAEITTYMKANFARAKDNRRWYYRIFMMGEWPILLRIMGKGEGRERYLSVAEVKTLFEERRLPERITARLISQPETKSSPLRKLAKAALWLIALGLAGILAMIEFPDRVRAILPEKLAQVLPPPLPDHESTTAAYWLEQNWSLEDRHWFHHVSQGTATFPVPYAWFVALEQPGIRLFSRPGLLKDSDYLERFGFIPSPQSIHTDETTLRRFGYASVLETTPAPAPSALWTTPVENFDGLPVGFARMSGVIDPATGRRDADRIGLTCAACHTGQIHYKGVAVRFDGGPAMTDLKKLELATGLAIAYTLKVPFRFTRFADRVLGPGASEAERGKLKQELGAIGKFLLDWQTTYNNTIAGKKTADGKQRQSDTEEGFGRLDALNRIGNQVFSQDFAISGVRGFEKNLHAQDAPVSFPPIWTVPWFKYAQYDASIEQPLIRNAGEALGVTALLNLSPDYPADALFRSSVALTNLLWIESLLRGPDPFAQHPKKFGGLTAPKWPSQIFADDAWKLNPERVARGRAIYAEICAECHLGPVNDAAFDAQFPDKSFWSSQHWERSGNSMVLNPVQKGAKGMGTDPAQADVLMSRTVQLPGYLDLQPKRDFANWWGCTNLPAISSTEMPYSLALMLVVDLVSRKWMEDQHIPEQEQAALWGPRKNCPNPASAPRYRARPLNGVWATAPYLHNGSVPSLYWLLTPAADRPRKFCMGARDFDPKQVGFDVKADESRCKNGQTRFSMTDGDGRPINGNSVLGHSLEGPPDQHKEGIIGRALSEEERYDLIEYLKTL